MIAESKKTYHGWMFTEKSRRKIVVQFTKAEGGHTDTKFNDSEEGAKKAADFVTESLKTDKWHLEPQAVKILGYRIFTTDGGVRHEG